MRRNRHCRITKNVTIHGMNAIIIENEKLRLTLLLDKGSDIIELLYKPMDVDFMWCSPVDLHNPSKIIQTTGSSLHNYLDQNFGGWQEIFPNGGPETEYKGCLIGMHGEASTMPWQCDILEDTEEVIQIQLSIRLIRFPMELKKIITLKKGEATIYLDEQMTNYANEEMAFMWGHHPTFGSNFIDESCQIETSGKTVFTTEGDEVFDNQRLLPGASYPWPQTVDKHGKKLDLSKVPAEKAGIADLFYIKDFGDQAYYKIINRDKGLSIGIQWDAKIMPYAWVWLVANGAYGYPWYGTTYSLAIEPWSSYSANGLEGAIENKTALSLQAGETVDFSMKVVIDEKP